MQIIRDVAALRAAVAGLRGSGGRIALVPTMGALHAGHMALVAAAKQAAEQVVASIFVNPKQFGANEDLDAYPRREAEDAAMLEAAGTALLWAPPPEAMYPPGFATNVSVSGISDGLCGAARPGHFDGVATIVAKLFNQVRPDLAFFGEKDFQQLAVIRRLNADLDLGVEIVAVPTVRDPDGLALSSRNQYLAPADRAAAAALPRILFDAATRLGRGEAASAVLEKARAGLAAAGFAVDYVELRDAATLAETTGPDRPARLLAAVRIGGTRLIDNVPVDSRSES